MLRHSENPRLARTGLSNYQSAAFQNTDSQGVQDSQNFFSQGVNRQILRQEPKYVGGGKYSIRKKFKKTRDPEPLVNFGDMEGSDQHSVGQNMLDQSSTKFSGANEPRKMLTSLQPSPSRDKRNVQSANLQT